MHPLEWEYRPDGLRAPALICGFKGWNDAADAASSAITFVAGALGAQRFASIDPEEFYDFQATRPRVKLTEGQAVPHYIAATPNPTAALALVRKLEGLVGVAVDASELEGAAADYDGQVNAAVQSDPDVEAFVERLEQAAESEADDEAQSLPS